MSSPKAPTVREQNSLSVGRDRLLEDELVPASSGVTVWEHFLFGKGAHERGGG